MKKIIKLAVLSAMSNLTVFMPLGITFADTTWHYRENTITKKMKSIEEEIDDHMRSVEREIDNHMRSVDKEIDNHMRSVNKEIEDHMRWVNKEIEDRMNPTKRKVDPHSASHSSPNDRSLQQRVAYTGSEHHHRHFERRTYHYSKHNTTTHHHIHKYYGSRNNSGEALAAGILGFAAGAIINNIFKKPEQSQTQIIYQMPQKPQIIYQEAPQIIYQPAPGNQVIYQVQTTTYHPSQQSQTYDWLQYCKKKYRSFNPETGTFRGRDGREYICYAPVN